MEKQLAKHLTTVAAAFAKHTKFKLSTVAMHALGNSRFFDTLKTGKSSFYVRTYDKLMAHMAKGMPAAKWPAGVPRPGAAAKKVKAA